MDVDILADVVDGSLDQGAAPASTPAQQTPSQPITDKQETEVKPVSLRDQISSALKSETNTPPSATQDGNRVRNPDGTFAPASGSPAATDASTSANNPVGAVAPPAAAPTGIDPQVFNALPAETQVQLVRTMDELNARQSRLYGYEQIEQLIAPRRQAWALNGVTEAQAVTQLFALSDYATRDPSGFIQYFAQQQGVDLESLVFDSDPGDPEITALKQQVMQLQGQLQGFNSQQQAVQHQNTVNEVVAFFDQKGANGTPLRPYADKLGDDLVAHIQITMSKQPNAPREQILQEAYERACWSNTAVRAEMQKALIAANEAERLRQRQQQVAKARTAGSSVPPGVPSATAQPANTSTGNLRDDIARAMAAASSV